jgi:hypothetical protein
MSKSLSRRLCWIGLIGWILAVVVGLWGFFLPTVPPQPGFSLQVVPGHEIVAAGAILLAYVALLVSVAGWLGALIRAARLQRWGWFVALIVGIELSFIAYVVWAPTSPPKAVQVDSGLRAAHK